MFKAKLKNTNDSNYVKVFVDKNFYYVYNKWSNYDDALLDVFLQNSAIVVEGYESVSEIVTEPIEEKTIEKPEKKTKPVKAKPKKSKKSKFMKLIL